MHIEERFNVCNFHIRANPCLIELIEYRAIDRVPTAGPTRLNYLRIIELHSKRLRDLLLPGDNCTIICMPTWRGPNVHATKQTIMNLQVAGDDAFPTGHRPAGFPMLGRARDKSDLHILHKALPQLHGAVEYAVHASGSRRDRW